LGRKLQIEKSSAKRLTGISGFRTSVTNDAEETKDLSKKEKRNFPRPGCWEGAKSREGKTLERGKAGRTSKRIAGNQAFPGKEGVGGRYLWWPKREKENDGPG